MVLSITVSPPIVLPVIISPFIGLVVVSPIVTSVIVSRPISIVGPTVVSIMVISSVSIPISAEGPIMGLKSLLSIPTLASTSILINPRFLWSLLFVPFHIHFADK